ncbi:hypothetical protein L1987_28419 [Smallanthus sonchifolius]|uniref:Uncharacterized protein n=1 Tax=Smallanthus sonchifolius TaxID=185202 RepID=A0ACB9HYY0_9ASTR|nr:hypothetical protein L1987_28419 [Smallanthus sonchifolius]
MKHRSFRVVLLGRQRELRDVLDVSANPPMGGPLVSEIRDLVIGDGGRDKDIGRKADEARPEKPLSQPHGFI